MDPGGTTGVIHQTTIDSPGEGETGHPEVSAKAPSGPAASEWLRGRVLAGFGGKASLG